MNAMFDLQNVALLVYYAKGLCVESSDYANTGVPSEKFIRQVCEEVSQIELVDKYRYPEILSKAFTYLNLIQLESAESLQPSVQRQIIDDVIMLYDNLDDIYGRYLDKM